MAVNNLQVLPFSRTQKRIRRELREQHALISLAIERKTLKIKRDNLDRVVFYPEHKIAFNRIAKSGNSSVLLYLNEAITGISIHQDDYKQAKGKAISAGKSLVEMSKSKKGRATLKEISFFTVVRNPWTRTLSAFLDKIANGPRDKYGSIPGFGDTSKAGFETFVAFLDSGGLHANHHWKPQSDALLLPASQFKSICKLEHLSIELPDALAETGLTLPSPLRLQQPHPIECNHLGKTTQVSKITQASNKLQRYYSPTTIRTVANLYSADFKLGRYSLNPSSIGLNLVSD